MSPLIFMTWMQQSSVVGSQLGKPLKSLHLATTDPKRPY